MVGIIHDVDGLANAFEQLHHEEPVPDYIIWKDHLPADFHRDPRWSWGEDGLPNRVCYIIPLRQQDYDAFMAAYPYVHLHKLWDIMPENAEDIVDNWCRDNNF